MPRLYGITETVLRAGTVLIDALVCNAIRTAIIRSFRNGANRNYEGIYSIKTLRPFAVALHPVFLFDFGNRVRWKGQRMIFTCASSSVTRGTL